MQIHSKFSWTTGLSAQGFLPYTKEWQKFRNIVVHQYEEVDAEIVILILRKYLGDFEQFKAAILSAI